MRRALHFLKAIGLLSLIFLVSNQTFAQTATPPAAGDGSESNPYEIATLENLYWLSQSDTAWDKHYIQTADIDASATTGWDNDSGFTPIGHSKPYFTGTYNGQDHTINSIFIDRPEGTHIALFGLIKGNNSKIEKLGLTNVNITGYHKVAAFAGKKSEGATINICFATGKIKGNRGIGGLVGYNRDGEINNCYCDVNITGTNKRIGGLVGTNQGVINKSYSYGLIDGNYETGGLVGNSWGATYNSFWNKETSNQSYSAGGIGLTTEEAKNAVTYYEAGWDFNNIWGMNLKDNNGFPFLRWQGHKNNIPPIIENTEIKTIDTNSVKISAKVYLITSNNLSSHGICWNSTGAPTTEDDTTNEGILSTTSTFKSQVTNLKKDSKYYIRAYARNTDTTIYGKEKIIFTPKTYTKPEGKGSENNPYQIATLKDLAWLMLKDSAWARHYVQTKDIDASPTAQWLGERGFRPIGNANTKFTGKYNGKGHSINEIYINRPDESSVGLFGKTRGSSSKIDSLGLINTDITGKNNTGALIGHNDGTNVSKCFTKGTLNGQWNTGGLIGRFDNGTVKNSFTDVDVQGKYDVGGFVGQNYAIIKKSYSYGVVNGDDWTIGGFAGDTWGGNINDCFWNAETSGQDDSNGGIGLTTEEMQNPVTFFEAGWDMNNIWGINSNDNSGFPFFRWQGYESKIGLSIGNTQVTDIDTTSAIVEAFIYEMGKSTITDHGVCWNTEGNPTIQDDTTNEGAMVDTGSFSCKIKGLKPANKYYFRSYAKNNDTIVYDKEIDVSIAPLYTKPKGKGSENNPYQIASLKDLAWLMIADTAWDRHYVQTKDIDASNSAQWSGGKGFWPIGNANTKFTGTYNGKGHTINAIYINRPDESNVGLFGKTGGSSSNIDSLGLINTDITGKNNTGALIGNNYGTDISKCFTKGTINGQENIGGLIGIFDEASVENSFTDVDVHGVEDVGGFVGQNNDAIIKNSYSYGPVNGDDWDIGGFAGNNWSGNINDCLWNTETSDQNESDGGIGLTTKEMQNPVTFFKAGWDMNNIWGINSNDNSGFPFLRWQGYESKIGLTIGNTQVTHIDTTSVTVEAFIYDMGKSTITDHGICWNTEGVPTIQDDTTSEGAMVDTGLFSCKIKRLIPANKYYFRSYAKNNDTIVYSKEKVISTLPNYSIPEGNGSESNPYQIANLKNLAWLMISDTAWDKHYIQTADIDASPTTGWDNDSGFTPIGNSQIKFTGTYNGQGHTINGLYINRPNESSVGLFGKTGGSPSKIDCLGLINTDITGKNNTGALIGYNDGTNVSKCFTKGTLNGQWNIGGLIGRSNIGSVKNSFTDVDVHGDEDMGGFVGQNNAIITNSYSYGTVYGDDWGIGGFAGDNWGGNINDCFWNKETSGINYSGGGTGLTTEEMKNDTTFENAGWDFACNSTNGNEDIWVMDAVKNSKYPFLAWQAPFAGNLDTIKGSCSVSISEKPFLTGKCGNKTVTATTSGSLTYDKVGTHTITWEFAQDNGNTITRKQMVKIVDNEKPYIHGLHDQTMEMQDDTSTYTVSGNELDPEITDNCQIDSITNDFNNKETLDGAELSIGTTTITWTAYDKGENSTSRSFDIRVSNSTSIKTIQKTNISIYPNPANNRLFYRADDNPIKELTMTDITGKTVIEKDHLQRKGDINISSLSKGLYIIHIKTTKGQFSTKVVKE